jgi:hypothetical protein
MNGTHEFLFCTDDIYLLGKNVEYHKEKIHKL